MLKSGKSINAFKMEPKEEVVMEWADKAFWDVTKIGSFLALRRLFVSLLVGVSIL